MPESGLTRHAPRGRATVFIAVAVVVVLVGLSSFGVVRADLRRHQDQTRAAVQAATNGLEASLEQALAAHGAFTQSVGAIVDEDGSVDDAAFRKLAGRVLTFGNGIRALELAPDGIITHIHPLVGNEAALGLDLNAHPSGAIAMERLRTGVPILVEGPISLAQGGQAVIIRSRVSMRAGDPTAPPVFWGVAINVVDMGTLLEQTGLADTEALRWSLHRGDGAVALEDLILGEDVTGEQPVTATVNVPGGIWTLAAVPAQGWPTSSPNTALLLGAAVALTAAIALFVSRLVSEPLRLRDRVDLASRELERSHAQTRAIMQSAADAIVAVDPSGRLVGWNPATCRLLRATDEDLEGTWLSAHLDLDQVELDPVELDQVELGEDERHRLGRATMIVTRQDGSTFPADVAVSLSESGELTTVIVRDVTDAQQKEADLERHVLELERIREEQDAIDAVKRDFMAMASHEVRTPITAIRGFALTLNRHWDQLEDEDRKRSLDVIHRQATRLWHVVSDVLTTSQLEGGSLDSRVAPVHVRSTIEAAVSEAQLVPNSVRIDCAPSMTARLDAGHLSRILVALLTNAHKYGAPPFEITTKVDGSDLVIRVVDHGSGVPLGFRSRLFDAFSQASTGVTREAIGTGLGLSVARGLARASGGDVWHEERHDAGACFAVRIPRAIDHSPSSMHDRLIPRDQVVESAVPTDLPA